MEEKRVVRLWRLVGIFGLLILTITTGQFFTQIPTAHAATVTNTIFLDTATNTIPVTTTNSSGTISYTITNFAGTQVGSGGPVTVANKQAIVTLPQLPDDYYLLHVTDNTVSPAASQQISFTVVAPFSVPTSSPFGVGTHLAEHYPTTWPASLIPQVSNGGATDVRDDMFWGNIEKTPGVYDFSSVDPWVNALFQQGLNPLLILDGTNLNYGGSNPNSPATYTAYANYAKAVVTHYPQLKAVEIYNEYNFGGSATNYEQTTQYAYQAIKSVRPDVTVVVGAVGNNDLSWFTSLFQAGIMPYADAFSTHPYSGGQAAAPEGDTDTGMINLQNLIKQYNNGQSKPIWITEFGTSTVPDHDTELQQAQYAVRAPVLALSAGAQVQKFFWYDFLNDTSDTTQSESEFGLIRQIDGNGLYTPKPSYTSYAVMTRQLNGLSFMSNETAGTTIYDELFSNNTRVIWTSDVQQAVILSTNNTLTLTTMTGQTQTLTPSNGKIPFVVTGSPVYLHGSISSIVPVTPTKFNTGFESNDPQPTWANTVDNAGYPAGGLSNVTGVCCGLSSPELGIRTSPDPLAAHSGSNALLYSGQATNGSGDNHAYLKAFDLSSHPLLVGSSTTLTYWINPESSGNSYGYASGNNSSCVAIDLIFSDGTNLRDSGALDQHGNSIHPGGQCNHLTLDTWNQVTVNLGAYVQGKFIVRLDVGYEQANVTSGYRGEIDDISIPFATSFESGDLQPTWANTVDNAGYPAGGLSNVTGVCCNQTSPELGLRTAPDPLAAHSGSNALLYSGKATNGSGDNHAYLETVDFSINPMSVDASTTLSYWINPESSGNSYGYASGNNSSCVAIDLIFSDGTNLRDSGALDQHGNSIHPGGQCNHLTLDTWNQVTVNLGSYVNGKKIIRLDIGYEQANVTSGYRGEIDDISIAG